MRVKLWSLFLATYEYISTSLYGPQLIFEPSDPSFGLVGDTRTVITDEFSDFVNGQLKDWNLQGLALAVVRANGVEFGTFGYSTEDKHPVTTETLFGLASCSKAFASAALGALIEDFAAGRNQTSLPAGVTQLSWKTRVKDVIPDIWKLEDSYMSDHVTLQDMLTHTTGMARHDYSYGPTDTVQDVVRRMRLLRPAHELREGWAYNSQMYMAASEIVAALSAMPFPVYVQKRLFAPLQMNATTYSTVHATHSGHMSQCWNSDGRRIPYPFPESAEQIVAPAGGVISNVVDLSAWVGTLLNRGTTPESRNAVLSRQTVDDLTTATAVMEGKAAGTDGSVKGYAKGWWRYSYRNHEVIAHSGSAPGISAHIRLLPHDGVGIVVLGNSGPWNPATSAVARRAIEDALGMKRIPWPETPETATKPEPLTVGTSPPLPLQAYSGAYTHPAYGLITLCERESTVPECAPSVRDFKTIECARARNSSVLYGQWTRLWSSHIRLTHVKGNLFFNDFPSVFSAGYGRNTTPFASSSGRDGRGVLMEFEVSGNKVTGFGMNENVVLATGDPRPIRERADAWFDRAEV